MKFVMFLLATLAATVSQAELKITDPVVRASIPGAPNTAAFMQIYNAGSEDVRLVAADSAVAKRTELHTHTNDNGVMRMREVLAIEIPAGDTVMLKPGGLHVMFMGVDTPLNPGELVDIRLIDESDKTYQVSAPVKKIMAKHSHSQKHKDH